MAQLIGQPTEIEAFGNKTKIIKEFIGRVNSKTEHTSIAQMESPQRMGGSRVKRQSLMSLLLFLMAPYTLKCNQRILMSRVNKP